MKEEPIDSIAEISDADWEKTPESVKQLVQQLVVRIEQLEGQYAELKAENQQLREQNQLLREQLGQNSQNSSKPPSQDQGKGFKPKAKGEKPSGRQRGGQSGHEGHPRYLYSEEMCQVIEEHYPEVCLGCGAALTGVDEQPYRVQIVEIPPIVPQVSEHRFHALECPCCGGTTRAWDEDIIKGSGYGVRVAAHVGLLSGQYRQSHQMVQTLLDELFGVKLSIGTIHQLRQESAEAVAKAVDEVQAYVQRQAQVSVDETSFTQGNYDGNNPQGRKGWLWVVVTPLVSYFAVFLSRSQATCQALLGEGFAGIVNSDRFSAYNWLELPQRQLCWAHLKRDFTRIAERTGVAGELGKALLEQQQLLFEYWYRVRDGTLSRLEFIQFVAPIQQQVHTLLCEGASYEIAKGEKTPLAKTVRTCQQLLQVEAALWTFVNTEGIEPTNNAAERALRPAVLWRKNSFGSQSLSGSLFVSRMLTVVTTLRSQNRSVLDYLVDACQAARQGQPSPSLLPIVSTSNTP